MEVASLHLSSPCSLECICFSELFQNHTFHHVCQHTCVAQELDLLPQDCPLSWCPRALKCVDVPSISQMRTWKPPVVKMTCSGQHSCFPFFLLQSGIPHGSHLALTCHHSLLCVKLYRKRLLISPGSTTAGVGFVPRDAAGQFCCAWEQLSTVSGLWPLKLAYGRPSASGVALGPFCSDAREP